MAFPAQNLAKGMGQDGLLGFAQRIPFFFVVCK